MKTRAKLSIAPWSTRCAHAGGGVADLCALVIRLQTMLQTCGPARLSERRLTGRLRSTVTHRGEPRRQDPR